jgi:hypothetical protein
LLISMDVAEARLAAVRAKLSVFKVGMFSLPLAW